MPLQLLEEVQQHLIVGDELAAATAHDPVVGLLAGAAWDSSMGALGLRTIEQFTQLNATTSQMTSVFTPLFEFAINEANASVAAAQETLIEARMSFIDVARGPINT